MSEFTKKLAKLVKVGDAVTVDMIIAIEDCIVVEIRDQNFGYVEDYRVAVAVARACHLNVKPRGEKFFFITDRVVGDDEKTSIMDQVNTAVIAAEVILQLAKDASK